MRRALILAALLSGACRNECANAICVGEYESMSGSEATFGADTHDGVMMAVDEINAAGGVLGKPMHVILYDDQSKSQEAGTAMVRLVTWDKVKAVIGEVASTRSLAGGRVAQQFHVPMVTPSSTNEKVTKIGDMISRVCFVDGFQGKAGAIFAKDTLKATKVAVLFDQKSDYSVGLKNEFTKAFQELGGTVTSSQAYSGGDQDYSAQLTTIRGESPDVLYVPGYYTEVGNIALQARRLGITAPLLGGDGWDSEKLAEIGGEAIEGSYYTNHYAADETRPEVQEFVQKYKARYGAIPDGLAALGYDATKLIADAMTRAHSDDTREIAKAIRATKDFHGVTGVITINAHGDAEKPAVIVKMKGGIPVFVQQIAQ
jgi:branched-chain amino acid transport system substrate-binding protein